MGSSRQVFAGGLLIAAFAACQQTPRVPCSDSTCAGCISDFDAGACEWCAGSNTCQQPGQDCPKATDLNFQTYEGLTYRDAQTECDLGCLTYQNMTQSGSGCCSSQPPPGGPYTCPQSRFGDKCLSNTDCGEGYCADGGRCTCVPNSNLSAPSSTLASGPQCGLDTDCCDSAAFCYPGDGFAVCRATCSGFGEYCETSAQCCGGACTSNVCSGFCSSSDTCVVDSDCCPGFGCDRDPGGIVNCEPQAANCAGPGASCQIGGSCCSGTCTDGGTCASGCSELSAIPCQSSSDCGGSACLACGAEVITPPVDPTTCTNGEGWTDACGCLPNGSPDEGFVAGSTECCSGARTSAGICAPACTGDGGGGGFCSCTSAKPGAAACTSARDCDTGDCVDGACQPVGSGNPCVWSQDCATQACADGLCRAPQCSPAGASPTEYACCGNQVGDSCVCGEGACLSNGDCCTGSCQLSGTCSCAETGAACVAGEKCCSGKPCPADGTCACSATGESCVLGGRSCCSGACVAGDGGSLSPVFGTCAQPQGSSCAQNSDCLSRECYQGTCQCVPAGGMVVNTDASCSEMCCTGGNGSACGFVPTGPPYDVEACELSLGAGGECDTEFGGTQCGEGLVCVNNSCCPTDGCAGPGKAGAACGAKKITCGSTQVSVTCTCASGLECTNNVCVAVAGNTAGPTGNGGTGQTGGTTGGSGTGGTGQTGATGTNTCDASGCVTLYSPAGGSACSGYTGIQNNCGTSVVCSYQVGGAPACTALNVGANDCAVSPGGTVENCVYSGDLSCESSIGCSG